MPDFDPAQVTLYSVSLSALLAIAGENTLGGQVAVLNLVIAATINLTLLEPELAGWLVTGERSGVATTKAAEFIKIIRDAKEQAENDGK